MMAYGNTAASVQATALNGWQHALQEYDLNRPELDENLVLFRHKLSNLNSTVSLAKFVADLEEIGRTVGKSSLFWRAGETFDLSALGDLGAAVLSAKSLRTAVRRFADYFSLIQDSTELRFEIGEEYATLSYRILDPNIWPRSCDASFTLGLFAQIIRRAAGFSWHEVEVTMEADRDEITGEVASIVGTGCTFGGESNMIRFPVSFLDRPLPPKAEVTPKTLDALGKQVIQKKRGLDVSARVKMEIYSQLGQGAIDQNSVARELGMSSRTLRRKLTAEGVSFQNVLDECRMLMARLELRARANVSLSETALKLGYSEHSTFSRAFARWCGMAPQDYRKMERAARLVTH